MTAFILSLIGLGYILLPFYFKTVIPDMELVLHYAAFPYMILSLLMFLMFWIILTLDGPIKDFIPGFICEMALAATITFFMLSFHTFDKTPIVMLGKYSAMHGACALFALVTCLIVGGLFAVSLVLFLTMIIAKVGIKILK